jgi:hypothetical protein
VSSSLRTVYRSQKTPEELATRLDQIPADWEEYPEYPDL